MGGRGSDPFHLTTKAYKNLVASLGCLICYAPAELHHIRAGMGAGQRNDDYHILPLCPVHHRLGGYGIAFHAGSAIWQERFGSELTLHKELNEQIASALRYESA